LELSDLAYTLSRGRGHRLVRTDVIADKHAVLISCLRAVADGEDALQPSAARHDLGPVRVFSGQGSQWAAMGAELLATEPVFAAKIAEIEPLIAAESDFSVTEVLLAAQSVTGIHRVQPTIFAMQVAMAAAMASHGVRPGAV